MEPPAHRPHSRNWLGMSLLFALGVFVGGVITGIVTPRAPRLPQAVDSEEFEAIPSPFVFTQWDLEFAREVADLLENDVHAYLDGLPVLNVRFTDEKRDRIESVDVYDRWGRQWIMVDLQNPFVGINLYEQQYPSMTDEPRYSMRDDGADGIPDYWIHWEVPKSLCPTNTIEWGPCPKKESDPVDDQ